MKVELTLVLPARFTAGEATQVVVDALTELDRQRHEHQTMRRREKRERHQARLAERSETLRAALARG